MGKPVIMGRKTHESIGRAVAWAGATSSSRARPDFRLAGVERAGSLVAAIDMASEEGVAEVCVIGGGQLYAEALPLADRLYITHVMAEPQGDTCFPPIVEAEWLPVSSGRHSRRRT